MPVRVFVSLTSGNMEIKKQQDFILQVLTGRKVEYEEIDITDPAHEKDKMLMREKALTKPNQKYPLPPQIFNDEEYCGDYDTFTEANEDDLLMEFLKLPRDSPDDEAQKLKKKNRENKENVEPQNVEHKGEMNGNVTDKTDGHVNGHVLGAANGHENGVTNADLPNDESDVTWGQDTPNKKQRVNGTFAENGDHAPDTACEDADQKEEETAQPEPEESADTSQSAAAADENES